MSQKHESSIPEASLKRSNSGNVSSGSPAGAWYTLIVFVFFALSYFAFNQSPRHDVYSSITPIERIFYPLERDSFARLPLITGRINDVHAIAGSSTIWLVGDGGLILKSTDDGQSWQQRTFPGGPPLDLALEQSDNNESVGFEFDVISSALAEDGESVEEEPILERDSFEQYQQTSSRIPPEQSKFDLKELDAGRASRLPAAKSDSQATSTLAQGTFELAEPPIILESKDQGSELLPDLGVAREGVQDQAAAGSENLLSSINAAEQIRLNETPPEPQIPRLNSVQFLDQKTGIIVGDEGFILLTTDGGNSWNKAESPTDATLLDVVFTATGATTVGSAGTILESDDRYGDWQFAEFAGPPENNLRSVAYFNPITLVVGDNGVVLKKDPRGAEASKNASFPWIQIPSTNNPWFRSVKFNQDGTAVAVGGSGAIIVLLGEQEDIVDVNNDSIVSLNDVAILPDGSALAVGEVGEFLLSQQDQSNWQQIEYRNSDNRTNILSGLNAIARVSGERFIAVGDQGVVLRSENAGTSWYRQSMDWQQALSDIDLGSEGVLGFAGWIRLTSLSKERSVAWLGQSNYQRYPAVWYWLLCLLAGSIAILFSKRKPPVVDARASITDALASDRPLEPDQPDPLEFGQIARGLSRFIRNPSTEPPLTAAIIGKWGTGKSSLMNLLYYDLQQYGFTPVWFNAWHHQKGEQLLASLYANIREQAIPRLFHVSQLEPVGMIFRWNLLMNRIQKNRMTTLMLLVLFFGALYYLSVGVEMDFSAVTNAVRDGEAWDAVAIALLGSTPLAALIRTMRGFGLDPMRLVSMGANSTNKNAKMDPSARQKFAREFSEVTQSLPLGRMVIFIDDLDRCGKENVVDILEAINFLSVSGNCYIVLGMDEKWVKMCVSDHFEKMAADDPTFADQYLEKMVNIRIPVPVLGDTGVLKLLEPAVVSPPEPSSWPKQVWEATKSRISQFRVLIAGIVVMIAWLLMGQPLQFFTSQEEQTKPEVVIKEWRDVQISQISMQDGVPRILLNVDPPKTAKLKDLTSADTSLQLILESTEQDMRNGIVLGEIGTDGVTARLKLKAGLNRSSGKNLEAGSNTLRGLDQMGLESIPDTNDVAEFVSGGSSNPWLSYLLPGLIGSLLIYGAIIFAGKRPSRIVEDSADFGQALRFWQDWIMLAHATPRALKRFLNRVRYLAMRYRPDRIEPVTTGRQRFKAIFTGSKHKTENAEGDTYINEAGLVALNAIYAFEPSWVSDSEKFAMLANGDLLTLLKQDKGSLLSQNSEEWVGQFANAPHLHNQHFGNFVSAADRDHFLHLVSSG